MKDKLPWFGMIVLAFAAGWGWARTPLAPQIQTVEVTPPQNAIRIVMPTPSPDESGTAPLPGSLEEKILEQHFAQFTNMGSTK